ncbi:MAG: sugar phosphate nucleotidyltransferase [bacterium]|uniref:mannose-1-phosphate guanylyltransferase n=2 Tax=Bacteria candidate phyla TaxID=1783234 RepID=A0A101I074_UNCT6|nr:MAG: Mannose-1-phosphate guanylyltransferase [candidate division TA06 bacterium 32_111]KUK86328.1 MAG: Mannose-1-phosphate guanylyltransferase [candidate division TA06 bacterium 34_109]MDI6699870.1 sugar phosphate nucleotidyltransferase [bacterium]HAF08421.1 mannose-1-phosphate guanylyltransferase [candidate division WOR-3 bacterium]HCP17205.1 mannose-1-phosphate guanylyltransferase [candidate division WOR-3 bacterium]
MEKNLYGIILAGGRGERFWPRSKKVRPKQLLPVISKQTMLEETFSRLNNFIPKEKIFVVGTEILKEPIDSLGIFEKSNLMYEPFGKNTALAIGFAAIKLRSIDKDSVMLVCPADHSIFPDKDFQKTIQIGIEYALKGNLVTFGITPTRPDEGYGYIELGESLLDEQVYKIKSFKEKPNVKRAISYLKKGNTLWNSGIFLWKTETLLEGIEKYLPDMYRELLEYEKHIGKSDERDNILKLYEKSPATSIDFGVMEQAENIVIVRAQFNWDDVGDWNALERIKNKDKEGNIVEGEVVTLNSKNSIIISDSGLVTVIGVSDLIVVRTENETLVCKKNETGEIKNLLKILEKDEKYKKYL